jgi:uncharacterized protein YdeI (BOF family)
MKNSIIILFLLCLVGLVSCKKDTPVVDARDKFVGSYQGTFQFQYSGDTPNSSTDTHTISKSTSNSNQIIIDGDIVANVNGNSYTYVQFTEIQQDPTYGAVSITLNGVGTLNGSNLTESGTFTTIIQGTALDGTWSSNLVKQ